MSEPLKVSESGAQPFPAKALVAAQQLHQAAAEMVSQIGQHVSGSAPDWPNCLKCEKPMNRVCHPPRVDGHWQQYVCGCGEKTEEFKVA